jgi:hypothetical protein
MTGFLLLGPLIQTPAGDGGGFLVGGVPFLIDGPYFGRSGPTSTICSLALLFTRSYSSITFRNKPGSIEVTTP